MSRWWFENINLIHNHGTIKFKQLWQGGVFMCQVAIDIPDAVMYDTHMTQEETRRFVRRAVALVYYSKNGVSIGYCAQIAGMTEEDFIAYLGENHVSIFKYDDKTEFMEELNNA